MLNLNNLKNSEKVKLKILLEYIKELEINKYNINFKKDFTEGLNYLHQKENTRHHTYTFDMIDYEIHYIYNKNNTKEGFYVIEEGKENPEYKYIDSILLDPNFKNDYIYKYSKESNICLDKDKLKILNEIVKKTIKEISNSKISNSLRDVEILELNDIDFI